MAPDELETGFQRLRESLPKNGWKVVACGCDTSASKNPESRPNLVRDEEGVT